MSLVGKKVGWESPSNIAIVKYWGKYGKQLPRNPSVSFTLSNAVSKTWIEVVGESDTKEVDLEFFFEGIVNPKFGDRVKKYLGQNADQYSLVKDYKFKISSENTFPHSSGIASSASGMSAIALGIVELDYFSKNKNINDLSYKQEVSNLARLGSGSASRSVFSHLAVWGQHDSYLNSSNEYAIGIDDQVNATFKSFHDDILIVSKSEKSVSSSAGHQLMEGNIYAQARYEQANIRMTALSSILKNGDVEAFGKIAEDEALVLHALMMASDPSYILMEPTSLAIINKIRNFRADTKLPIFFSLDAGPNIHLLYPDEIRNSVSGFINEELKLLCANGLILKDEVGKGPRKLEIV